MTRNKCVPVVNFFHTIHAHRLMLSLLNLGNALEVCTLVEYNSKKTIAKVGTKIIPVKFNKKDKCNAVWF